MADQYQIRRATVADAGAIAGINVAAWKESYVGIVPRVFLDSRMSEDRVAFWKDCLSGNGVDAFLALDEARAPIGYAVAGPRRDGPAECRGEVYSVYVLERAKGRGVGRRLIRCVAGALTDRALLPVFVFVFRDNVDGRRFYEALGAVAGEESAFDLGGHPMVEVAYRWRPRAFAALNCDDESGAEVPRPGSVD